MPSPFVLVTYWTPVASFTTNTSAPAIAPPEGSRTIPLIVAFGDCPNAAPRQNRLRTRRKLIPRTLVLPLQPDLDTLTRSKQEIPRFVPLRGTTSILMFSIYDRKIGLGVIGVHLQVGEEKRLPTRLLASAIRFDRHKDGINLFQLFRIIEFHDPALLRGVVLVEDPEARRLLLVETAAAPSLKGANVSVLRLLVEIIRVENQRLSPGVEHPAIGLLRLPIPRNVIDLGDVKVTGSHEFANISVMGQQFLLFAHFLLAVVRLTIKLAD